MIGKSIIIFSLATILTSCVIFHVKDCDSFEIQKPLIFKIQQEIEQYYLEQNLQNKDKNKFTLTCEGETLNVKSVNRDGEMDIFTFSKEGEILEVVSELPEVY